MKTWNVCTAKVTTQCGTQIVPDANGNMCRKKQQENYSPPSIKNHTRKSHEAENPAEQPTQKQGINI